MSSSLVIMFISCLLIFIGFLGCFIHKVPGPVMAFIGMLVFIFGNKLPIVPWTGIIICAILLVISAIAEKKVIPFITQKISEFGNSGKWGCIIGSLLGLLFIITGSLEADSTIIAISLLVLAFIIIPFLFAFCFEAVSRKSVTLALKPATAAFLTYFLGMILKLGVCIYSVYVIFTNGENI